jgi:hypothetical protein
MPYDEFGNITDIAVFSAGCIARLNPGQLYEQYMGAVKRDYRLRMLAMRDQGLPLMQIWAAYLEFLSLISPPTYESAVNKTETAAMAELDRIFKDKIVTFDPDDNAYMGPDLIRKVRVQYPPNKSRVFVHNFAGIPEATIRGALIGPVQFFFLDKSDFKSMAVAVPRLNNFRLPSTQNKSTKVSKPVNVQAPRFGEDELRSANAVCGGERALDHIELSTNPEATAMAVRKGWDAKHPTAMRDVIDRNRIPYGSGVNIAFAKHILGIVGLDLAKTKGN